MCDATYKRVLETQYQAIAHALHTVKKGNLVVLDIDETCLDNVQHVRGHRTLQNEAIPECKELFTTIKNLGLKYAFVSGRREKLRHETTRDLKRAGLQDYEHLYLCPNDFRGKISDFKLQSRQDLKQRGYTIACTIGDQLADLVGGCSGVPFLIYNPYYQVDECGTDVLL